MTIFLHKLMAVIRTVYIHNNYCFSEVTQLSNTKDKTTILVNVTFIPVFKRAGIEEWRDKAVFT